jgi:2,4-dienoyl-CoA reductase-like NADH-dependent reductase (Old Yellow Enzyme family)
VQLQLLGNYARPRALTEAGILELVQRFAVAARTAREAGFTGAQVHSAHGYLLSSFLSPVTNQRTDAWGGSIGNRARFLIETLRAIRRETGADFPLSVKLNSDDFRKGGFTNEECLQVVGLLNAEGLDLLEISGGTYEQPKLLGADGAAKTAAAPPQEVRGSTRKREAYFIDYAEKIRAVAKMPLMVTGGFRSRAAMEEALAGACDVIGIGRPLISDPDCSRKLLAREIAELPTDDRALPARANRGLLRLKWFSYLRTMSTAVWYYIQIFRLADGLAPDPALSPGRALWLYLKDEQVTAWKMRKARKTTVRPE